jgi:spermidine synthase
MAREHIVYDKQTEFGHYQVIDMQYEGRAARVLFSDDHRAAQSGVALDEDSDLLFDYNQRFLELLNGVRPKKILIIGGGAYTLSTAALWALPEASVDVVEIDPALWDIAEAFFGATENNRLRHIVADGADYLKNCSEQYDAIIIDAFVQAVIPDSLQTTDTMTDLNRLIRPKGLVAFNVISSWYGSHAMIIQHLQTMLRQKLTVQQVFPAGHGISLWQPQNFIVVASRHKQSVAEFLRYEAIGNQTKQPFDVMRDVFGLASKRKGV